jgi:hypothetical protein
MGITLPVVRLAREHAAEAVCRSNLRQMAVIAKTYGNDQDGFFPPPGHLYHSTESFSYEWRRIYTRCCRWHDARIGLDSALLRNGHPELRGCLWPYLGSTEILRCKAGYRANLERGCHNSCTECTHDGTIDIVPQYTYTMNKYLCGEVMTGGSGKGPTTGDVDPRTIRKVDIRKETHVTRSPSEVFVFGEENSWAINTEGKQPMGPVPMWAAPCNLSGKYYPPLGLHGTIGSSALGIRATFRIEDNALRENEHVRLGDALATCHRPYKGDLNTGHSYVSLLDGHVRKVTLADQLRQSRRPPGMEKSRLGPGGNLALAWPLDIPPPGGWENQ